MKLTTGKIIDDWGRTEMTAYIPLRIEAREQNVKREVNGELYFGIHTPNHPQSLTYRGHEHLCTEPLF